MNQKKRWITLLAALLILTQLVPAVSAIPEIPFTDVTLSDWFYADVRSAYNMALIDGRSATTFAPNDLLTYAEAVKLAACMYQVYTDDAPFVVTANPWYQIYVDYCLEKNIIDREYPWQQTITRGAYMDIFSRALPSGALSVINSVDDGMIPDVPMTHRYAQSIYTLYRAGIVRGQDDRGNCAPESYVKRSEVAAILSRMMDKTKRVTIMLEDPSLKQKEETPAVTPTQPSTGPNTGTDVYYPIIIPGGSTGGFPGGSTGGFPGGSTGGLPGGNTGESSGGNSAESKPTIPKPEEEIITYYTLLTTPFGIIQFPEKWQENIRIQTISVSGGYGAEVFGRTASGEMSLCTLQIGAGSAAERIGYVGTQEICIHWGVLSFGAGWTQDDEDIICAMQEEFMNHGVEQIRAFSGFSLEKTEIRYEDFILATTSIGPLMFPGEWQNQVRVQNLSVPNGSALEVYGRTNSGEKSLFVIYIGTGKSADLVGYVGTQDVCIAWSDLTFGAGWSQDDEDSICAMQEAANKISAQIESMPGFTKQKPVIQYEDFVLATTSIGPLMFPGEWQNQVRVQNLSVPNGSALEVYGRTNSGEKSLFVIYIGTGRNADLVGYVGTQDVCIAWSDLTFGPGWSQEDEDSICAMQEAANEISVQIEQKPGFTTQKPILPTTDFLLARTSIGDLTCPGQWQGKVQPNISQSNGLYTLEVIGTIGREMKLFTLYIGVNGAGDPLGTVNGIPVSYVIHDLNLTGITDSDMVDTICAMHEEIMNDVIMQIEDMPGYSS